MCISLTSLLSSQSLEIKNMAELETNPYLEELKFNLDNLIENINSLRDSFGYSETTLRGHHQKADNVLTDYLKSIQ